MNNFRFNSLSKRSPPKPPTPERRLVKVLVRTPCEYIPPFIYLKIIWAPVCVVPPMCGFPETVFLRKELRHYHNPDDYEISAGIGTCLEPFAQSGDEFCIIKTLTPAANDFVLVEFKSAKRAAEARGGWASGTIKQMQSIRHPDYKAGREAMVLVSNAPPFLFDSQEMEIVGVVSRIVRRREPLTADEIEATQRRHEMDQQAWHEYRMQFGLAEP